MAASILGVAAILFILTIISLAFENERRNVLVRSIEASVSDALVNTATSNAYGSFDTVRESSSGAICYTGDNFTANAVTDALKASLRKLYGNAGGQDSVAQYDNSGKLNWQMKNIAITVQNGNSSNKKSYYDVSYILVLPNNIGVRTMHEYPIKQKVEYMNKF
ncbi:MAG: hypothetical protein RR424_09970 [Oscillospiraceae bacterium]